MTYFGLLRSRIGSYRIEFPDFPELLVEGGTLAQVEEAAVRVLAATTGELHRRGDPLPDPTPRDQLKASTPDKDAILLRFAV